MKIAFLVIQLNMTELVHKRVRWGLTCETRTGEEGGEGGGEGGGGEGGGWGHYQAGGCHAAGYNLSCNQSLKSNFLHFIFKF